MEEGRFDAEKVVGLGATVSGIAIALGTVTTARGPELLEVRVIPAAFLLSGALLIGAAILAMDSFWRELGLSYGDDLLAQSPDDHPALPYSSYLALVVLNWGLWLCLPPTTSFSSPSPPDGDFPWS